MVNEHGLEPMQDFGIDFDSFDLDLGNFAATEFDLGDGLETRYIKPPKSTTTTDEMCVYELAEKLAESITLEKGCNIFTVVNGKFIFGDLIEALAVKHDLHYKRLVISTLSMSMNNVDSLANLIDWGYCDCIDLIVSDYFFSHERKMLIPYLYEKLDKENRFQLAAARTHCKTINIETECGLFLTIHGSANLRSSGNIEQFMISEGRELFDFNVSYQDAILAKFATIDKSIGGKALWQAVQQAEASDQGLQNSKEQSARAQQLQEEAARENLKANC